MLRPRSSAPRGTKGTLSQRWNSYSVTGILGEDWAQAPLLAPLLQYLMQDVMRHQASGTAKMLARYRDLLLQGLREHESLGRGTFPMSSSLKMKLKGKASEMLCKS